MKYRFLKSNMARSFLSLFLVASLAATFSVQARVYTVFNGGANGVTIRDEATLAQSNSFTATETVNRIAAGPHRNLYVTSGDSIFQYDDRGTRVTSFTFGNSAISYGSIAVGDGKFFVGVSGAEDGISVRDARTFAQSVFIEVNYQVGSIAAGGDDDFYVTVDNVIYRYNSAGEQIGVFEFSVNEVKYENIAYANGLIYVSYTGSGSGISVRDGITFEQVGLLDPGFAISGIAAGDNDDLFLTSGTNIYRYSTSGVQLATISFSGIDYQGIAVGSGELSQAFLMTNAASSAVSTLNLVNTSSQTQEFFGTLYNGAGTQLGLANTSLGNAIAAGGRVLVTSAELESLFETSTWSGPAVLEVTGSASFDSVIKLKSPSGLVSNTNCTRQGRVDNIEGGSANGRTFIRFINTGDTTISNISGTLTITENGSVRQSTQTLISSLAPKAAAWKNGDEISQLFNETWSDAASMTVTSSSNLRLLNLNFVNEETFFNFSCYESSAE